MPINSMHRKIPILLILKTPPPVGGGEILCAALKNHVKSLPEFLVLETYSKRKSKSNQGGLDWYKIIEFVILWLKVIVLIKKHKPVLIFSPIAKSFPHFCRDSIIFWTSRLYNIPFAGELAGASFYFLGQNKLKTLYGKVVLSRFICLRVLGSSIAQKLKQFGINNTIVTDNGVECINISDYDKNISEKNNFRILFVGTLSQQKGFDTLVYACNNLAQNNLPFEVHAMGEWISEKYRCKIETFIIRTKINHLFTFHGLLHGKNKRKVFQSSDILVLPSYVEGQPLVILEALSVGMPVVSTDVGAIPDTIQDGKNGFIINPGDTHNLEKKIALLMENPHLRKKMKQENLVLYNKRFTENAFLRTQVYWLRQCASGELSPHGQFIQYQQNGNQ